MFDNLTLTLAQEDAPPSLSPSGSDPPQGGAVTQQPLAPSSEAVPPSGVPPLMYIIPAALVIMIIFSMSGQRREKKKREQMISSIKKGDKVQTIGGIIGTTVEVRDEHVVLKIDENTNTRVKFSRSSIQAVHPDKDE